MIKSKAKKPGGHCYQQSFLLLLKSGDGAKLVHGTVFSTYFNRRIDHAWLEINGFVIDPSIGISMLIRKYYAMAQAKHDAKYIRTEASRLALRTKHYGFWTKEEKLAVEDINKEVL